MTAETNLKPPALAMNKTKRVKGVCHRNDGGGGGGGMEKGFCA